jgi:hypothetical protein
LPWSPSTGPRYGNAQSWQLLDEAFDRAQADNAISVRVKTLGFRCPADKFGERVALTA